MRHSLKITLPVLALGLIACNQQQPTVTSFDECVAAGNAVMESYPRQCRSADGELFVEDVAVEEAPITLTSPTSGDTVASPFVIEGEARGTWYFEASFSVELQDEDGNVLVQVPAEAQSDWMTEDFVPYQATLDFVISEPMDATLILRKANASGLPEYDDEISIPLHLEPST